MKTRGTYLGTLKSFENPKSSHFDYVENLLKMDSC